MNQYENYFRYLTENKYILCIISHFIDLDSQVKLYIGDETKNGIILRIK